MASIPLRTWNFRSKPNLDYKFPECIVIVKQFQRAVQGRTPLNGHIPVVIFSCLGIIPGNMLISAQIARTFLFGLLAVSATINHTASSSSLRSPDVGLALPPITAVRLLEGPFAQAVKANLTYILAHEPNRLLAPFLREAGLEPRAGRYGNWESIGLDGHTAGHYMSALAYMIASGADTPDGQLRNRLDYILAELDRCQQASGDGYIGGIPASRQLWSQIASGQIKVDGGLNNRWVPWYNLHKTFAGLRDAYLVAGHQKAKPILIRLADWCERLISGLSDQQIQTMLSVEHGGMNEVLADVYAITGEQKYLHAARRFCHKAVLDPLIQHQDRLTGLHANTQIPKVTGLARIAILTGDNQAISGARFFWQTVTRRRSVAFGGNSVSEHFNDPNDYSRMIQALQGPETCNTYNMLRLTELLFTAEPNAAYTDYYERALYNHILASIHPTIPGYVYFTPIRPGHYRVYSQPGVCFWCCVGTGMENPGRYGSFIYARAKDGIYVNLFIPSELSVPELGLTLRQETSFPDQPSTRLTMRLKRPSRFTLWIRHPGWVPASDLVVRLNGNPIKVTSRPCSYTQMQRRWRDGDRIEVELPMRTSIERLPDGSDWVAILHGPILLASPAGTNDLVGLRADSSRMGQEPRGPTIPLDQVPVLRADASEVPRYVRPDPDAGPLRFRLVEIVEPNQPDGLPLMPFFRLHDARYQIYWQVVRRGDTAAGRPQDPQSRS